MSYTKQPTFYVSEYTTNGYLYREYVASLQSRLEPIADSLVNACRDDSYGSPESAARDRARLLAYRDRGVTHMVDTWRNESVTFKYVHYKTATPERWSTPEAILPTDMSYIAPAYKALQRILARVWKDKHDWREPEQLQLTLERMGYKRAYLVPDGPHGGACPVMLRSGMTELEPREPTYSLTETETVG